MYLSFCSIYLLWILTSATLEQESLEAILFQPVLKAYSTCHSWIITTHISSEDLEKQWKMFIQQKARSQKLLNSLQQKPLTLNYLLSALQAELANLDSIYTSYKPLIFTVTQLLKREPSFNSMSPLSKHAKRSLLPFLGMPSVGLLEHPWDVRDTKNRVNQLIKTQTQQQETLVHVISILNVTRYAMHVNRQHITQSWKQLGGHAMMLPHSSTSQVQYIHLLKLSADSPSCLLHSG